MTQHTELIESQMFEVTACEMASNKFSYSINSSVTQYKQQTNDKATVAALTSDLSMGRNKTHKNQQL